MHNFRLDDFLAVNRKLAELREQIQSIRDEDVSKIVGEARNSLVWIGQTMVELGLEAQDHFLVIDEIIEKGNERCSLVAHYLDEATRSIDYQIRTQWTYHYGAHTPNVSGGRYRWQKVLRAFPSTAFEVESALDLFALQHFTASIFHFMRVAEHGLRALAVELSVVLPKGKPLTHANWQDIIDHCDKQLKQVQHSAPAGPSKDAALAFYSGALSHLHHLKNKYRNEVMHARSVFGIDHAVDASQETKKLMELLASKLSEKKKAKGFKDGKIDWGF